MLGSFYDDYLHIGRACFRLSQIPGYRTLISSLHCYTGENSHVSRVISVIFIVLTLFLVQKILLAKKFDLKKYDYLIVLSHPVVLFPFFYASQLSTSMTFLWASILSYFNMSRSNLLISALLIACGLFVRYEAVYFYIVLNFSIVLLLFVRDRWSEDLQKIIKKTVLHSIIFFLFSFLLKKTIHGFTSQDKILSAFGSKTQLYPTYDYYLIQIKAILLYLRNIFLSFNASFYYPWSAWINVKNEQMILVLSALICLIISLLITIKKRTSSLGVGFLVFFGSCILFSLRLRTDWYFQSRQYFGTLFLLFCSIIFINRLNNTKVYKTLISLFFISSTIYHLFFHYSDRKTFLSYEQKLINYKSPSLNIAYTEYLNDIDKIHLYFLNYKMIEEGILSKSLVARKYWLESLLMANLKANELGDLNTMKVTHGELMRSESFFSTLACLHNSFLSVSDCASGNRPMNFCNVISMGKNERFKHVKLRLNARDFCSRYLISPSN